MNSRSAGWVEQWIKVKDAEGNAKIIYCLLSHETYLQLCMRGLCEELPKMASEIILRGAEVNEETIREWLIAKDGPYYTEEQKKEFLDKLATLNGHFPLEKK